MRGVVAAALLVLSSGVSLAAAPADGSHPIYPSYRQPVAPWLVQGDYDPNLEAAFCAIRGFTTGQQQFLLGIEVPSDGDIATMEFAYFTKLPASKTALISTQLDTKPVVGREGFVANRTVVAKLMSDGAVGDIEPELDELSLAHKLVITVSEGATTDTAEIDLTGMPQAITALRECLRVTHRPS